MKDIQTSRKGVIMKKFNEIKKDINKFYQDHIVGITTTNMNKETTKIMNKTTKYDQNGKPIAGRYSWKSNTTNEIVEDLMTEFDKLEEITKKGLNERKHKDTIIVGIAAIMSAGVWIAYFAGRS